jgi:hypothetical protein
MRWSDAIARPTDRKLREFAVAGAVICLALATWQMVNGNALSGGALLLIAVMTTGVAIWRPRWLAPLFTAAMVVTFPLAWAVSLTVLALVYFGLMLPLALWFCLLGRDALSRRIDPSRPSYWQPRPASDNPRRYLRQY